MPCRYPCRRQALRHHQAYHVASKPPHGSHDSFPFQRRTHRNGQLHAWTQEHKDDADLREDTKEKLNQDMENLAARLNNVEEFAGCTI